ncbi:hypothetical protein [Roseibacillus persicicus]|uniref:Uncharacterized protein n=1 Tax=Roseibacillus persicicus TaxID=454148 RepID=A0A918TDY8_9BACT|nr:hypothetical protein [Roseibacillus persicicus]GHC41725.1 hypothetical protein GCM10007100_03200 [Roseibacillus persicicus]
MKTYARAKKLSSQFTGDTLNEADTRHQIIDCILHEVWSWPKSNTKCEEHVKTGYADYILSDSKGNPIIVVEAKKEGNHFKLPRAIASKPSDFQTAKIGVLSSVKEIKEAVAQVAGYCLQIGCELAAITNGHSFVIFKAFTRGSKLEDSLALVIPSLDCLHQSFTELDDMLSYLPLSKSGNLERLLSKKGKGPTELFYPKNSIPHYDNPLNKNDFAKFTEPLAKVFFQDISPTDKELMEKCYVYSTGSEVVEHELKKDIKDSITPFFEQDGGKEIQKLRDGSYLTARIAQSIQHNTNDVVILYGGKGAGKSTFLRRLFYFEQPTEFRMYAFPVIVDFLQAPQTATGIARYAWDQLIKSLDQDNILESPIEELAKLFKDRLDVSASQELAAFDGKDFEVKRNELLCKWKEDDKYVSKCLIDYWKEKDKCLVVAFDNTDQLSPQLQDTCFLLAQNFSQTLGSTIIISMREERYCRARTNGVLDAYHNSGFHLSSPNLTMVFEKRLKFLISQLWKHKKGDKKLKIPDDAPLDDIIKFFNQCLRQFKNSSNPLRVFLARCAHDNVRQALLFFRQFTTSGYTHARDLINNPHWTVSDHQVIKPMMVPERHNYNENKSLIPNVIQYRNAANGSYFTGMRLLALLKKDLKTTPDRTSFRDVVSICDDFESKFGMRSDVEQSLDVFLRNGLIESNNRLDTYKVEFENNEGNKDLVYADEVRLTSFGSYLYEFMSVAFAYLDLVSLDTGLTSESLYNSFCEGAEKERGLAKDGNRKERLEYRIQRTRAFIEHLKTEEESEQEELGFTLEEMVTPRIAEKFEEDILRVEKSAKRNFKNDEPKFGSMEHLWE